MTKYCAATNIAETGITIPDITCVIDSGKHREMRFVFDVVASHTSPNESFQVRREATD
jgi:glycosidase